MSRMRSGELREWVTLQEAVHSQDTFGEQDVTWRDFATVRAGLSPVRGSEFYEAAQTGASMDYRIVCRWIRGVVPKMRVLTKENRTFEIIAVRNEEERGRWLELMCYEVV